ncbi:response regulator [Acetanaerobacterium elongatum]|uniref:Stage 0 sporulation protein A homolog n=1 Tax=Acetanaerobacterium elongatum TaxID=258515 RepID=A0A1G9ZUN3_9FIRM|nr:response regulator transcription factor [Acetanaerobacterium elongatum]SDN24845.1 two component transcriptional regulator, LuxR family [Acetanaerobacterium elongatum]
MRIVIVDDDRLVSMSLKTIVEASGDIEVAATGGSGREAVSLYEDQQPDILLMDIRMDNMTGLEAADVILKAHPQARVLFLTTFADDEYIIRALKIGAKGYILKQNFESIVPALKAVYSGQTVFGEDIVAKLPQLMQESTHTDFAAFGLTEKETEILTLIADGQSNKEIASSLYMGEGTVRNTISVILEKLHLRDRTQLAIFYYRNVRQ